MTASKQLAWALERARRQTLGLVADIAADDMCLLSRAGERHPAWILGHLLLADSYLLLLAARVQRVSAMMAEDLAQPLADEHLARSQPTIGHHLESLVFHEGYHAGQLAAWRQARGLPAVRWSFAP